MSSEAPFSHMNARCEYFQAICVQAESTPGHSVYVAETSWALIGLWWDGAGLTELVTGQRANDLKMEKERNTPHHNVYGGLVFCSCSF